MSFPSFKSLIHVLIWIAVAGMQPLNAAKIDFQSEVRPLLSDNCFQCHGPDPATRLAELRLDRKEGLFGNRQTGTPIVPGDPEKSLLFQRISHANDALRMPPKYSHKELQPEDIDRIREWIDQGAEWTGHWAFEIPKRPALPAVNNEDWISNSIDRFVLSRLEAANLTPAPAADRNTLARRAALDVTGLPPAPEKLREFLEDKEAGAYGRYLDRLFASETYGEHRARYWLDAARYADTHGIHIDNYREMWPYRDWVINAFNANLPFDQFTLEQIAGDLLPEPSMEQMIATGFYRCNATTNEGGVIPEEYEVIYAKDRADTTGTVFLGLTVGCATCHDHKFDPITQRDFYAMTAYFRNTTQYVMDGNISDTPPIIIVPQPEDKESLETLRRSVLDTREKLLQSVKNPGTGFEEWFNKHSYGNLESPLRPGEEQVLADTDQMLRNAQELAEGVVEMEGPAENMRALQFGEEAYMELPASKIDTNTPFSIALWVYHPRGAGTYVVASQTDLDDKLRGWNLTMSGRQIGFTMTAVNGDETSSIDIRPNNTYQLEPGTWRHITVTYDGSGERAGLNFYYDGQRMPFQGSEYFEKLDGPVLSDQPVRLGRGFYNNDDETRIHDYNGGGIADFRLYNRELSLEESRVIAEWPRLSEIRDKNPEKLTSAERQVVSLHYLNLHDKSYQKDQAEIRKAEREVREIRRRGAVTHVMQEQEGSEAVAHILSRGMYDQRREKVPAATPSFLPSLEDDTGLHNRLNLARWIIDKSNPLTTRVTVNRFWQQVFGTGLVRTTDDFGAQGETPSHPELLDWLAVEFRESGWDVKQLLRTILTASTYLQAAETDPAKIQADPGNRLMSRGPRFRMDAETLRDYGLAASGILVQKIGGPSVKPYQPEGVWETVAMPGSNTRSYKQDSGDKLYRRSLYTFWKRAAPPASMQIFNAPTREHTTVYRERTNTPLQALVTMNDKQFVEASRFLAQSVMKQADEDFTDRLGLMTIRLLSREFNMKEQQVAEQSFQKFLQHYSSRQEDAKRLLAAGEFPVDESLPQSELAAWTMLANQLMNLDEALNK